jgi:L-glutamine-phosphate cytidylyltransferase
MTSSTQAETPAKAIIIAAGRGRRLRPYTDTAPKCLVPVGGRSILGWQLRAYRACGVREIVIIRGYRGEVLEARLPELGGEIRLVDNHAWEHNNILESLFCAEAELDGPVLLSYSDIVFTEQVAARAARARGDIALVIDREFASIYEGRTEHPLEEAEVAEVAGRDGEVGWVTRVGKRALPADRAWGEFIGLVKLSARGAATFRATWAELKARYQHDLSAPFQRAPSFRTAYLTDMLQYLIAAGHEVSPVEIRGGWREIDTAQDLERAERAVAELEEKRS